MEAIEHKENNYLQPDIFDVYINGKTVPPREDGYFNASRVCKIGKKKWSDWRKLVKTQVFLDKLEERYSVPLIEAGRGCEVFVHQEVVIELIRWLTRDKKFKDDDIGEQFSKCQQANRKLMEHNDMLCREKKDLNDTLAAQRKERDVRDQETKELQERCELLDKKYNGFLSDLAQFEEKRKTFDLEILMHTNALKTFSSEKREFREEEKIVKEQKRRYTHLQEELDKERDQLDFDKRVFYGEKTLFDAEP